MKVRPRTTLFLAAGLTLSVLVLPTAVDAGAPVGSAFQISAQSVDTLYPAVAYNPDRQEYLVVWQNEWPASKDVYGQRVARDGTLVGPQLAISPAGDERYAPAVAYNSQHDEYLVVWEHWKGPQLVISGRRVSGTGQILGDEFDIASAYDYYYREPRVGYAFTSDRYLVVFRYDWVGDQGIQARNYYWDGSSNVLGSIVDVVPATGTGAPERPDLAYNRSRNEYLVVWQQIAGSEFHIYARRVQGNGSPLYPASTLISPATGEHVDPAVAAIPTTPGEGQYLVVWEDHDPPDHPGFIDIGIRRVKGDGTPDGGYIDIPGPLERITPAVAGYEQTREYLTVWTHHNLFGYWTKACLISLEGDLLGNEETMSGRSGAEDRHAAAASGQVGDFLVVSDSTVVVGSGLATQIFGRFWGNRVYLPLTLRNYK